MAFHRWQLGLSYETASTMFALGRPRPGRSEARVRDRDCRLQRRIEVWLRLAGEVLPRRARLACDQPIGEMFDVTRGLGHTSDGSVA